MDKITYSHAGRIVTGARCAGTECKGSTAAVFDINGRMYCGKDAKVQWRDDA